MTREEKQAIQTVLMEELSLRQAQEPTLLFDVLAANQGAAFIYQVVHRRWSQSTGLTTMLQQLLRAIEGGPVGYAASAPPPGDEEAA